jgi:pyrroloquinoline quinone (PQQ) biosynthesis protein C
VPDGQAARTILLRGDVDIAPGDDSLVLVRHGQRYEFSDGGDGAVARLVLALDGTTDLDAVAAEADIDLTAVERVADFLVERELAVELGAASPCTVVPSEFEAACRDRFAAWKRAVFDEPLWGRLADGAAPRSTFVGWLVECYHFIQGVNDRLALAVAQCTDPRLRPIFATHFVEEYDHARFLLDALDAAGVDPDTARGTRPLPGTLAVLHHMRHAARRSPLEYAVCSGFLESTGEDQRGAMGFLDQVAEAFSGGRRQVVAPLAAHVRLDEDYGHPDNFAAICARLDPIPVRQASDALAAGQLLAETLRRWCRDIEWWYEPGGDDPRLRLDHGRRPPRRSGASGVARTGPTPFPPDAVPLRSPHLGLTLDSGTAVVSGDDLVYTFRGPSADVVAALWPHLDGTRTLAAAAEKAEVDWAEATAHLVPLAEDDLVVDTAAVYRAPDPADFLVAYRALCEFWKKDIFTRPFWHVLASGDAPASLVLGWLVEFYHYIEAANEHMPASVAACRHDDVVQLWLARHYAEEYDHSAMFLDGLVVAGLAEHRVRAALPLATTRALINYITEVGSSDTVGYAAMHGIFQTPGSSEGWRDVERFMEHLMACYPFGAALMTAFRDHAALDAELGHDDLVFSRICDRVGHFSPERVDSIVGATRGLVEHFMRFFDGILDAYGAPHPPLPRGRPDIRGLIAPR